MRRDDFGGRDGLRSFGAAWPICDLAASAAFRRDWRSRTAGSGASSLTVEPLVHPADIIVLTVIPAALERSRRRISCEAASQSAWRSLMSLRNGPRLSSSGVGFPMRMKGPRQIRELMTLGVTDVVAHLEGQRNRRRRSGASAMERRAASPIDCGGRDQGSLATIAARARPSHERPSDTSDSASGALFKF